MAYLNKIPTPANPESQSILAVNLGLVFNIILAVMKTTMGIFGHSPALLADGINSTSDVAYFIVVRVFLGLSSKQADEEHPYGHRQLDSIAALVVGAFVLTTAVAIFWDAINKVYDLYLGNSDFGGASLGALGVALLTIVIKFGLTAFTRRIGLRTKNPAVLALAYDHRNDILSASAAAAGIFLGRAGYPWVDPLAGALVAIVVLRTGIEIMRKASDDLMDTVPGRALSQQIESLISRIPGVLLLEEAKAHRFGPYLVVNITICVDGALTVTEGDAIATQVEQILYRNIDLLRRVHIHYHPVAKTANPG